MYNRYIPQPDGSYRRNRMTESPPPMPQQPPAPPVAAPSIPAKLPPPPPRPIPPKPKRKPEPTGNFLRQLLPKDFDTEDLLIVVLLLLLSGDCRDDQNTALLTLVLYLFL